MPLPILTENLRMTSENPREAFQAPKEGSGLMALGEGLSKLAQGVAPLIERIAVEEEKQQFERTTRDYRDIVYGMSDRIEQRAAEGASSEEMLALRKSFQEESSKVRKEMAKSIGSSRVQSAFDNKARDYAFQIDRQFPVHDLKARVQNIENKNNEFTAEMFTKVQANPGNWQQVISDIDVRFNAMDDLVMAPEARDVAVRSAKIGALNVALEGYLATGSRAGAEAVSSEMAKYIGLDEMPKVRKKVIDGLSDYANSIKKAISDNDSFRTKVNKIEAMNILANYSESLRSPDVTSPSAVAILQAETLATLYEKDPLVNWEPIVERHTRLNYMSAEKLKFKADMENERLQFGSNAAIVKIKEAKRSHLFDGVYLDRLEQEYTKKLSAEQKNPEYKKYLQYKNDPFVKWSNAGIISQYEPKILSGQMTFDEAKVLSQGGTPLPLQKPLENESKLKVIDSIRTGKPLPSPIPSATPIPTTDTMDEYMTTDDEEEAEIQRYQQQLRDMGVR